MHSGGIRDPRVYRDTLTSRLCRPLLVLGPGCWAHWAALGYPTGSAKIQKSIFAMQLFLCVSERAVSEWWVRDELWPVWWWWLASSLYLPPGWTGTLCQRGKHLGGIWAAQTCLKRDLRALQHCAVSTTLHQVCLLNDWSYDQKGIVFKYASKYVSYVWRAVAWNITFGIQQKESYNV